MLAYLIVSVLFRVSSCSWSRRSLTPPTSLQTRRPGLCTGCLSIVTIVMSELWVKVKFCVYRLEEIQSPSKKLPPESTPRVMFTGFEPTQVQQYTKVKPHHLNRVVRQNTTECYALTHVIKYCQPDNISNQVKKSTLPPQCLMVSVLISFFLQRLHALGGEVADNSQRVTHLVASKVTRTVKFLTAMSVVKHIVSPEWLEESWRSQKFVGMCVWLYIRTETARKPSSTKTNKGSLSFPFSLLCLPLPFYFPLLYSDSPLRPYWKELECMKFKCELNRYLII